jgi:hypothetical protein
MELPAVNPWSMTSERPTAVDDQVDRAAVGEVHVVEAIEATITVFDHHVQFERTGASRPFRLRAEQIRRVQVDFEVGRPATVAIVPDSFALEAQLLTVHEDQFDRLFPALHHLARDLHDVADPNAGGIARPAGRGQG